MSLLISESEDSNNSVNITEISESLPPTPHTSTSTTGPQLSLFEGKFFKYLPESSTSNNIVALCMKCSPQKIEVKGYHNCSSNFLSHLKRKHGEDCVEEYKNYVKKKKNEKGSSGTNSGSVPKTGKLKKQTVALTQEQFDENIVKYFIHSMIPLRAIEDPYFLNIFTDLNLSNIGLKVISRRTLGRRIKDYYTNEIAEIMSKLHETDYVCTTVDIWSGRKRSFIGVTAHWITKDLCRMSMALACRRFKGTHSYDHISELVQEINSEFNLTVNKIVATITDNGSNFVKAFKMFGVKLTNIKMVDDCDLDTDFQKQVLKELNAMHLKLNDIMESVALLLKNKKIQDEPTITVHDIPYVVHLFPINEQTLAELEQWLNVDAQNKKKLIIELSRVGGLNVKDVTRRIMYRVFTNEVGILYSWEGAKKRNPSKI